jgi:hypothetical protein
MKSQKHMGKSGLSSRHLSAYLHQYQSSFAIYRSNEEMRLYRRVNLLHSNFWNPSCASTTQRFIAVTGAIDMQFQFDLTRLLETASRSIRA